MNSLLPIQKENASALTMSSREIAELCEKEHKTVLRDIRVMLIQLYGDEYVEKTIPEQYRNRHSEYIRENADNILNAILGDGTKWHHPEKGYSWERDSRGYISFFRLDKEHSLTLIAGYNVKLRKRIIDRWQELENQQNQVAKIPQTYSEALRLAADLADQNQALQIENNQKSEHIESLESYFRPGMTAPQFVKGLNGVNSNQINTFLSSKNWLYVDRRGDWRVTSQARDVYMTEETTQVANHGRDPMIKYKPTLLKKGAAKIFELYTQNKLPMKASWNGEFTQDKAVGL